MSTASTPSFYEFKKQASFFIKEKIKSARLVLTDVTPIQLLTEEAVSGNQSAPDTQALSRISKAAFELDEYWRIVEILHGRLARFERKSWRECYNSLFVLEHLLTHGPESVADEFQSEKEVISLAGNFQYIDEKGFNWGLAVRKKSERVLKLLEKGPILKEERQKARKLTREIKGFGSFSKKATSSAAQGILKESSSLPNYERSRSYFDTENQENQLPDSPKTECIAGGESPGLKENAEPSKDGNANVEERHRWNYTEPSRPLLDEKKGESGNGIIDEGEDHPFSDAEHRTAASLLN